MRVLVTGSNGFLGSWLASALTARGDEVRCLVRAKSDLRLLERARQRGATLIEGDVVDPAPWTSALEGVEVVFHLAGIRRAASRDEFLRVNAEATGRVAEAMVKAGARRLVLCGSLAASGPSVDGRPRVEADPLRPEEWYGESKAEAERIAFGFASSLEITSCRPARILGPGDRENLSFFKLVKRGVVLRILGPERRLSVVDVEDAVDLLLLQADRPEAKGEAFFCAGEETTTLYDMMRSIAGSLGIDTRTVPVPPSVLSAAAALADGLSNLTGWRLPLSRKLARQLLAPGWTCSIDKARRLLGYAPKRGVRASLEASARSYQEAGWL